MSSKPQQVHLRGHVDTKTQTCTKCGRLHSDHPKASAPSATKRVFGTVLLVPEYDFDKLKFAPMEVATVKDLVGRIPGGAFCIDALKPERQILPGEDSHLIAAHSYLIVTKGRRPHICMVRSDPYLCLCQTG